MNHNQLARDWSRRLDRNSAGPLRQNHPERDLSSSLPPKPQKPTPSANPPLTWKKARKENLSWRDRVVTPVSHFGGITDPS